MRDLEPMDPERPVQRKFRKAPLAGGLLLLAGILAFDRWMPASPNRTELGWRNAPIALTPVRFDAGGFAPLRLAGAWQLTSDDRRLGGVSALAVDRGRLLALTDSGVLIRFAAPPSREALKPICAPLMKA